MNTAWRMVVVDDDSKVRVLLERAFRAPQFETHSFPTGTAALRRIAEIRPNCVVSDILMPDMDGENLLRAVRAMPRLERVPFIAISAVRSEARIRAVLAAGADAFLLKPFPLRDLIDKVRGLVERPATARSTPEKTGDYTSPTRPVVAVPHTTSTAAIRRRPPPTRYAPPKDEPVLPPAAPPAARPVPPPVPPPVAPPAVAPVAIPHRRQHRPSPRRPHRPPRGPLRARHRRRRPRVRTDLRPSPPVRIVVPTPPSGAPAPPKQPPPGVRTFAGSSSGRPTPGSASAASPGSSRVAAPSSS